MAQRPEAAEAFLFHRGEREGGYGYKRSRCALLTRRSKQRDDLLSLKHDHRLLILVSVPWFWLWAESGRTSTQKGF